MFVANLLILAQIYDKLSHGEAKFPRILSQNGQNDLRSRSMTSISNTSREYPKLYVCCKLVILDQICDELSCGQGKVYGWTDR